MPNSPSEAGAENTDADASQQGDIEVDDGHISSEDDGLTGRGAAHVRATLAAEVRTLNALFSSECLMQSIRS